MAGLVEEIQKDALDDKVSVSSLLRKVKLAAAKLGLEAIEEWVEAELKGYKGDAPEYRVMHGTPMGRNPFRGWEPISGPADQLSKRMANNSISEIEDLIERGKNGLMIPYPDAVTEHLNKVNDIDWGVYALQIDRSQLVGVLDTVRNMVMDWAIALEKNGVLGSGISFRPDEVEKAHSSMTWNIGKIENFAGNMGQGNTSGDIRLNVSEWSNVQKFADEVHDMIPALEAKGADGVALAAAIADLKIEAAKPNPDKPVVKGLLQDIRNAMSGAAGSLIASGIISQIKIFLGG